MTSAEEPIQAVEENDQTIVPSRLPEQAKQVQMPMLRTVSFTSLIHQWQPMGFRVRVDLPFISDDSGFLFIVRNGPYIPVWYARHGVNGIALPYIFHWNNTRPVYHHKDGGAILIPGGNIPPSIDKGITITQHDMPPILATMAASFRKWRGDMQYRFRIVAGFATQGYLITMPIKNAHVPIGIYDEYSTCPPLMRMDSSYREGMINSYVPSDTSMFRHTEITLPYEYPMPWYDQYHWLEQRTEVSAALTEGYTNTKLVIEPCGDNYIGLGFRGAIESQKDTSFIMIELEYRAVEGFQFADPGIPPFHMLESTTSMRYGERSGNLPDWYRLKAVPDKQFQSDGISSVTIITNGHKEKPQLPPCGQGVYPCDSKKQPYSPYVGVLAPARLPDPNPTISDHGDQPLVPSSTSTTESPEKRYAWKQCRYDKQSRYTTCLDWNGSWHSFQGDKREELGPQTYNWRPDRHPSRGTRDVDEVDQHVSVRERDFMY